MHTVYKKHLPKVEYSQATLDRWAKELEDRKNKKGRRKSVAKTRSKKQPCAGCGGKDTIIYPPSEKLPQVVWLCLPCIRMYEDT